MDPFIGEPEINWAPDATLWGKCQQCDTKHYIHLNVSVEVDNDP